jgi:hypothetical protein
MTQSTDLFGSSDELAWWDAAVLAAANIVPTTRLATDYLNVFHEAIMLLGLLPDMPDMIDELLVWQPLTYEEHFARSGFMAKELAILAYQKCEPDLKAAFDGLSDALSTSIAHAIITVHDKIKAGEPIAPFVATTTLDLRQAVSLLDSLVHGGQAVGAQDDIDALFD